jgi:hypothetical protein
MGWVVRLGNVDSALVRVCSAPHLEAAIMAGGAGKPAGARLRSLPKTQITA